MSHELIEFPLRQLAGAGLPASAWAVWAALKVLDADGHKLTVEAVMRITGLPRSTVYDGRRELAKVVAGVVRDFASENLGTSPVTSPLADSESEPSESSLELERAVVHSIVHREGTNGAAPAWQQAVTTAAAGVDITKSRDLFHEVFAPAYDTVATEVNECIALAASYVETATGETLDTADRKKVALLVRTYGKAGVFGIHQALGVTEDSTNMLKYARAVAMRTVREHRPR